MPEPVLRTRGLRYRYPGGTEEALAGVELDVEPGELLVVCGDSGSGKTTLLRAACGLVPHFHGGAVEGELEAGGLDVRAHGPAELASVAGLVAQEPEAQVVSSTVRAELELPLELRGQPPAERARAVEEVALGLAIADLLERTTDTLSGGELQRVALAATLVGRPRLLLLDEPTSQLDPVAGDELIGVLRRINEEWGVSVILSEHRLERCLGAADRVVAMNGGSIAFDGDPSRFLEWALRAAPGLATPAARVFGRVGLEPPATVRRARAILRDRGVEVERAALDGPEAKPSRAAAGAQGARADRGDALLARRAWLALGEGGDRTDALRGLDLRICRGEKVALMGRNGAGKTTLLRAAAGLLEPDSGHIQAPHGIALLPQRSDDVLVRESVAEELPGEAGATALQLLGLEWTGCSDPRDLSGGERQRLALAVVIAGRGLGSGDPPGAVLLDEPTRGLDRGRKADLARLAGRLAERGAAVVIATHDVEFAAEFADRVLIMGRGEVVADGPAGPLLSGGWYFSTEVARALSGQAYRHDDGVALLRAAVAAGPGGRAVAEPGAQA